MLRLVWMAVVMAVGCGPSSATDSGGGSGDDGTPGCDELEPSGGSEVTLRVTNQRSEPIYLNGGGCGPPVGVADAAGDPVRWRFPDCDQPSCVALLAGDCAIACADCAAGIVRVEPGATYELPWPGTVFTDVQAPPSCRPAMCDPGCHREIDAPAASYQLTTQAWTVCPFDDPAQCECDQPGTVCTLFYTIGGLDPPDAYSEPFDLPGVTTVELSI